MKSKHPLREKIFAKLKHIFEFTIRFRSSYTAYEKLISKVDAHLYPHLQTQLGPADVNGKFPFVWARGLQNMAAGRVGGMQLSFYLSALFTVDRPRKSAKNEGRLKILFVSGMFPNEKHGGGLRFFDIMDELSKKHDISLYSIFTPHLDTDFEQHVTPLCKNLRAVEVLGYTQVDYSQWLANIKTDFDVIYHLWPQSVELMKISKGTGAKVVYEYVECVARSAWIDVQRASKSIELDRISGLFASSLVVESTAAILADACIALTTDDSEFIRQVMAPKVLDVFPTGVSSFAILKKQSSENAVGDLTAKSAVFVGYYDHTPNIEALDWYFTKIHMNVVAKVPGFTVKIVGRGYLEGLKSNYQNLPGIEWVGEVGDIVPYITSSAICICPLISGAGLRGKVIQYSILGRPTVSTSIGVSGTPFIDQESVLVADSDTKFASDIVALMEDPLLYKKIATNAKEVATRNFAWDPVIERLEAFFRV